MAGEAESLAVTDCIRVNCGGATFTNAGGVAFLPDQELTESNQWGFTGGNQARAPRDTTVGGTDDDLLFLSERWGVESYTFRVDPGIYDITFYFNDSFFKEVGRRVFDVLVNGKTVIDHLDIVEHVGGSHALIISRKVSAGDEGIVISTFERSDKSQFCAISVESAKTDKQAPPAPTSLRVYPRDGEIGLEWPKVDADDLKEYRVYRADSSTGSFVQIGSTPLDEPYFIDGDVGNGVKKCYRITAVDLFGNEGGYSERIEARAVAADSDSMAAGINVGGESYTDERARIFIADQAYNPANGIGFQAPGKPTTDPTGFAREPYASLVEGVAVYKIDLPVGVYRVSLGFFDAWSQHVNDRAFHVYLNDFRAFTGFDILAEYGSRFPVEMQYICRVQNDEGLTIRLENSRGTPILSSIYVEPAQADHDAPERPRIIKNIARDSVAYIEWTASAEKDVVGYHLLRAANEPVAFSPIADGLVGVNHYVDHSVENGRTYFYHVAAVDASGNVSQDSDRVTLMPHAPNDEELLDMISRAAFAYFVKECDPDSYLTYDKSVSEVVSVAAAGFGLSALCVGAERGWMPWEEAEKRAYVMLRDLNYHDDNKVNGLFYHFVNHDGSHSEEGYENVISTIDSALLMWGAIAAGEYFGGRVKSEMELMMSRMNWRSYADDSSKLVMMAYRTEDARFDGKWDYFTDEALLVTLLGISAPNRHFRLSPDYFYSFLRERGRFKHLTDIIMSWSGALFTYTFAHCWLDFRTLGPDNPAIAGKPAELQADWWENTVKAIKANKAFCRFLSTRFKTFGENAWGLTASSGPNDRYIVGGSPPCGGSAEVGGGTLAPYGAGMSVPFLPEEALSALHHYYQFRNGDGEKVLWVDEFDGGYGFIDAFNLDEDYFSEEVQGIDHGPMLLLIENYRSGLLWKLVLKNEHIREGLKRVGFAVPPHQG